MQAHCMCTLMVMPDARPKAQSEVATIQGIMPTCRNENCLEPSAAFKRRSTSASSSSYTIMVHEKTCASKYTGVFFIPFKKSYNSSIKNRNRVSCNKINKPYIFNQTENAYHLPHRVKNKEILNLLPFRITSKEIIIYLQYKEPIYKKIVHILPNQELVYSTYSTKPRICIYLLSNIDIGQF